MGIKIEEIMLKVCFKRINFYTLDQVNNIKNNNSFRFT